MKKAYQILNSVRYDYEVWQEDGKKKKKLLSFTYYGNGKQVCYDSYKIAEMLTAENKGTHLDNLITAEKLLEEMQVEVRKEANSLRNEERRKTLATKKQEEKNNTKQNKKLTKQVYKISNPTLSEIIRNETIENVRRAILQLLPEQQELIDLVYFQEVKAADIAKRDNVSPSAISKRLSRAEAQLKKLIA